MGRAFATDMPLLRSLGGVAPAENEKGGVVDPVLHTCRSYGAWERKGVLGESGSIHMPLLTELGNGRNKKNIIGAHVLQTCRSYGACGTAALAAAI